MTTNDSKADVVIIGAGIVGCCTAYYLAKRGVKVAIVEKGEVAGEQSSRAWGWGQAAGPEPERASPCHVLQESVDGSDRRDRRRR